MDTGQIQQGESRFLGSTLSDRYLLRSEIGRGANGTIYLGDDQVLNRPVIIKLLHASDQQSIDRFQKEIALTRKLEHPNIVRTLDAGFGKDGRMYSVTEWEDGKDLDEILRVSGPLGTNNALQVAIGIAETLAYVHSQGLLHRDLKPSNVLIPGWPSAPKYRNPKILDFGVAGRLSHGLTQTGAVFGTPRYMSPEQIRGEAQSPATDVYGLGLLLFEMLTGHAPWSRTEDAVSLFRAILEEELPEHELRGMQPDLANLIRQCLRRNPQERPSIETVLRELEMLEHPAVRVMPGASVPAPNKAMLAETRAARRWVWMLRLGAVVVVSVLIVLAFFSRPHAIEHVPAPAAPDTTSRTAPATVSIIPKLIRSLVFLGGLLLMWASVAVGFWLRRWLGKGSSAKAQAYDLMLGAKARVDLTATIALQLDDLVTKLRGLDERILAGTVALMLDEYGRASDAKDRQSALMNVVTLSEKLAHRLSPWYERYKEVIASAVAVLGAISGLLTAITSLLGAHK
jgi:tRNA A-37 threonylcarbamoyl transferase component Bud32